MSERPKFTAYTGRFRAPDEKYQREFNRYKYDPKKISWIQRNPRKFVKIATTTALLIFFSAPIYHLTIGWYLHDPENPKPRAFPAFHRMRIEPPGIDLPRRKPTKED